MKRNGGVGTDMREKERGDSAGKDSRRGVSAPQNYALKHEAAVDRKIKIAVIVLLIGCILLSLLSGRYNCTTAQVLLAFFRGIVDFFQFILEIPAKLIPSLDYTLTNPIQQTWDSTVDTVVWTVRVPRIIGVLFVGGGLSITGACYQGVFQNPLVSDSILGVSAGAGFGAALAIFLSLNGLYTNIFAFLGAILAVFITYSVSRVFKGNPTLLLVLTGTVVASLFSALISIVQYMAAGDSVVVSKIVFWLMGAFTGIDRKALLVLIPVITFCSLFLHRMRWSLNVLSMGDRQAHSLGVDVRKTRLTIIAVSTLMSSVCVCYCGLIGWIGVVIPQMTRMLVGPDNRRLIPLSFFFGAIFMILVDIVCRSMMSVEIPVSIVTSIVGAPMYLVLLRRVSKGFK